MALKVTILLPLLLFISACSTPISDLTEVECEALVESVTLIPLKPDIGSDNVKYYEVIEAGKKEHITNCLISSLTNEKRMAEPRQVPGPSDNRVGDTALYLLWEIYDLTYRDILPQEKWEEWDVIGTHAYTAYVKEEDARRDLKIRVREVIETKYGY